MLNKPLIKVYKTRHAIKYENFMRFLLAVFFVIFLFGFANWYIDSLKRSMTEAFTDSISGISAAFETADKMMIKLED